MPWNKRLENYRFEFEAAGQGVEVADENADLGDVERLGRHQRPLGDGLRRKRVRHLRQQHRQKLGPQSLSNTKK